jgi:hypothetical protein
VPVENEMEQRTGEKEQVGQNPEQMRPMFSHEEKL